MRFLHSTRALCWLGLALLLPTPSPAAEMQVAVFVYGAYGTPQVVHINGRALEAKAQEAPKNQDGWWRNLKRAFTDWESDEIKDLPLRISTGNSIADVKTDKEGLFQAELRAEQRSPFSPERPPKLRITLGDTDKPWEFEPIQVEPVILVPESLAVISDVDDTIVDSQVTNKAMLAYRTFFENAATLHPIPGTPALYRAIAEARSPAVPFFYLSGSPVNLYTRLQYYLDIHKFPSGPMILKNIGRKKTDDSVRDQKGYKLRHLQTLADRLPGTRFILFGDSGQDDGEVYATFCREKPERVIAAFIRRIEGTSKSDRIPYGMCRTEDAFDAARRLVRLGLVPKDKAEAVGHDVWGDNPIPPELLWDLNEAAKAATPAPAAQ